MLKMLTPVAEQKLGYSFGKPLRVDEKSLAVVLPIIRDRITTRQYITMPESEKVFCFDTGAIDGMDVENQTEFNVFVRSGTIFKGATQERASIRSAVIFPGKKQRVTVRCIHRTRGISGKASTKFGGITPLSYDQGNYSKGYTAKSQSEYWTNATHDNAVRDEKILRAGRKMKMSSGITGQSAHSAGSPEYFAGGFSSGGPISGPPETSAFFSASSDDLTSKFEEFSMAFDDVLSKVKLVENQAGLALINHNGVETIEFFDHADSWKALHESAVKRLGNNIVTGLDDSVFEFRPDNAIKLVLKVLALDYETNPIYTHKPADGEPEVNITGLSCKEYVGEAVEVNGNLIHLVLLKQAA